MKKLIIIALILCSCADANERLKYLKKQHPYCKVEPATGLIQHEGYEFIIIDSTNQIIAVSFYPFSETKVESYRNVR